MSQQAQCEDYDLTPESRRDDTTGPKFSHQQTVVEPSSVQWQSSDGPLGVHTGMPQGFQRGLLLARRSQYPRPWHLRPRDCLFLRKKGLAT